MNRYPIWKFVVMAVALVLGLFYTVPNFYGQTPVVQVSGAKSTDPVDPKLMARIEAALKQAKVEARTIAMDKNSVRVEFADTEVQLKAKDVIDAELGERYIVALNLVSSAPPWMARMSAKPMSLGLDLRGGVHLLLEVDMKAALDKTFERRASDVRRVLRTEKVRYGTVQRVGDSLEIPLRDQATVDAAEKILSRKLPAMKFEKRPNSVVFRLQETEIRQLQEDAIKQNIQTLHKRVNAIGVAEPVIQQQGPTRIVVQLPGLQDPTRAIDILGRTSTLELHLVNDDPQALAQAQAGAVPSGFQLLHEKEGEFQRPILIKKDIELTGDNLTNAKSDYNQNGEPAVVLTLDSTGADIFKQLTRENINKRIAIVMVEKDKSEVVTAPNIREEIGGGTVQISGAMTTDEAADLALVLRAGALAAPMNLAETRVVGPSMGKDNIDKGLSSTLYGFIVLTVCIIIYYRVFGLISALCLSVNLVLLVALLSTLQATLTLPGIAAIALTLGMAIDANVLVNERIREELKRGLPPQAAINAGYDHAWATILDSNITTLIAGLCLFGIGSGAVKGFAVVHVLGILTSMFSAVFFSRGIVSLVYGYRRRLTHVWI